MKLIARTPCSFGGVRYYPGNEIPEEVVISPAAQVEMGTIVIADSPLPEGEIKVNIPVLSENGPTVISVASESICEAVRIMQLSQADAIADVKDSDDGDMVTIITLCESNKTILSVARKRLAELEAEKAMDGGSEGEA